MRQGSSAVKSPNPEESTLPLWGETVAQRCMAIAGMLVPTLFVLFYCLPVVGHGAKSLSMLRYFDRDEHLLVEYGTRFYQDGILPQQIFGYPKFFYFVAGLFLYPYTFLFGPDSNVVAITFRAVNIASIALTAIFVNLISIKFFRSYLLGPISSLLFVLTPGIICWGLNSRTHPLEVFLITVSMYIVLSAVKGREKKMLWIAVVFAGLAMGTKYGGIFLIPTIVTAYGYLLWAEGLVKEHLRPEEGVGKAICLGFVALGLGIFLCECYGVFFVTRNSTGLTFAQERGWPEVMFTWPFYLGLVATGILETVGLVFFLVNRKVVALYAGLGRAAGEVGGRASMDLSALFGHKIALRFVKVSLAVLGIFLLIDVDLLIFWRRSILTMVQQLYTVSRWPDESRMGFLSWFALIPRTSWMGVGGTLIVVQYLVFDLWQARAGIRKDDLHRQSHRSVLLSYVLVHLGSMVLFVNFRDGRFMIPVFAFLFILGVDTVIRMPQRIRGKSARMMLQAFSGILIAICILERLPSLLEWRRGIEAQESDPGVAEFVPWLSAACPDSAKIMVDNVLMYVPDHFTRLKYWKGGYDRVPGISEDDFLTIQGYAPDVFIRSNVGEPMRGWDGNGADTKYLLENYSVARTISNDGIARKVHGWGDRIEVYVRNGGGRLGVRSAGVRATKAVRRLQLPSVMFQT